jgi:hypothetical protein
MSSIISTAGGGGGGGVTTATLPLVITGADIEMPLATTSQDGYISQTDWDTFNGKQAALGFTPANKAGDTFTGDVILDNEKILKLRELTANGTNFVGIKAPASVAADCTFTLPGADGAANQRLRTDGSKVLSFADEYEDLVFSFDGGGVALAVGLKAIRAGVGFSGTIVGYYLATADGVNGSVVLDLWATNAALPTVSNTITASAKPTLSSAQYLSSTTLTAWTTAIAAGDCVIARVDSATVLSCNLVVRLKKG